MATVGKPEIWNCSAYQQMWKAAFIEDGASSKEKKEKEKKSCLTHHSRFIAKRTWALS